MERGGARTASAGRDSRGADALSGPEREGVRGALRAVDQGGMSRSDHSDRGRPFPTRADGVCHALPSREIIKAWTTPSSKVHQRPLPVEFIGGPASVDCSTTTGALPDQPFIVSAERWDRTGYFPFADRRP